MTPRNRRVGPRRRPVRWPSGGPARGLTWALALLAVLLVATPAAADPAGPTNYTAEVIGIEPPVEGLDVEVLGGDAFLQLRNEGHDVLVPGYDGEEQYLRFDADGTVSVNLRSNSYWQNQSRYLIGGGLPTDLGADQPPRWEPVSTDGTWAWHDHRVHWMSPRTLPTDVDPTLDEVQLAYVWPEPVVLEVDGEPVEVAGQLTWFPAASPTLAVLGLVLGVLLVGAAAIRGTRAAVAVGVGVGVVATGLVGLAGLVGLPPGVQGEPLPIVLTVVAAVVAAAGLAMHGRTVAAGVVAGAAGIPLMAWALANAGAVTAPVVPPDVLPAAVVRLVVGLAAGTGVATVVVGVRDLFGQPLTQPAVDPGA